MNVHFLILCISCAHLESTQSISRIVGILMFAFDCVHFFQLEIISCLPSKIAYNCTLHATFCH